MTIDDQGNGIVTISTPLVYENITQDIHLLYPETSPHLAINTSLYALAGHLRLGNKIEFSGTFSSGCPLSVRSPIGLPRVLFRLDALEFLPDTLPLTIEPNRVAPVTLTGRAPGATTNNRHNTVGDMLSAEQRGAITDKMRECWTKDAGMLDLEKMHVMLTVTADASGVVRKAEVAEQDRGRLSDPRLWAFARRAISAVMDARCSALPLPIDKLGAVNEFTIVFRP